ncbi:MAG: CoA-transferase [Candidatus Hydrogenedens sp.]
MNTFTKIQLLYHIAKWRATWDWRNTKKAIRVPGNPKFMGAREAVGMIKDGSVIATSGLAGNMRASFMWWAIKEMFQETGHPCNLTIVSVGGQGGRGKIPGTLEELGLPGLCTRIFTGHTETYKSILKLADQGHCEIQIIPQGTLTLILKAMGEEGKNYVINKTGVGTFIDPRTGRGTPLFNENEPQYVSIIDDEYFKYECPWPDVAIFNAPSADKEGNIYQKNAVMIGESYEITKAVKKRGGIVIANVAQIVDKGHDEIFLPASDIDAIVVWKGTEQTGGVKHIHHWDFLTLNSKTAIDEGIARVRFVNKVLGITPRRTTADEVLARLSAKIFVQNSQKGDYVDIGVGLPEEASRLLYESGVLNDITLMTESGVMGGLPAPGIFFGAAINPTEIVSSATVFQRMYQRLDSVILGALEVDGSGNVNVSKRGEGAINYVGPGGFIDLTTSAKKVFFCVAWGNQSEIKVEDGKVKVLKAGQPKFIEKVSEITFNGQEALKVGKKVFYITHIGAFALTERGMELRWIMPGVDIEKDILNVIKMPFVLPENGPIVVDDTIISGRNFKLNFE